MTSLTRRAFGFSALAAPAIITVAAQPAFSHGHAAAQPAMFDAPLGNYRITSLFDGMAPMQRGFFFGDDNAITAALEAGGIVGDSLPAPVNAFLLQSDDRTILIDAGLGEFEALGPGFGRMADALAAAGVAPTDIDLVVVTHAHPDHIGGMVAGGAPVFTNAEVVIPEGEISFWGDAGMMAQAPEQMQGLFQAAQLIYSVYGDQIRPVASGAEVAPGLTLELSPGHTPGHSLVHIDGGDSELLMIADTLHSSVLHTALPDIGFGFDVDPEVAAQSRRRVFERAIADRALIAATHVPFPGFGRIVRAGDAYAYAPASLI